MHAGKNKIRSDSAKSECIHEPHLSPCLFLKTGLQFSFESIYDNNKIIWFLLNDDISKDKVVFNHAGSLFPWKGAKLDHNSRFLNSDIIIFCKSIVHIHQIELQIHTCYMVKHRILLNFVLDI